MIPVLLTQTQAAAGEDPRSRGDKPAGSGEFASLLDSLSEMTGEAVERPRTALPQDGHDGPQKAQPSTPSSTVRERAGDSREAMASPEADTQLASSGRARNDGQDLLARLAALVRKEAAPHASGQEPSLRVTEAGKEIMPSRAPSRSPAPLVREATSTAGAPREPGLWSVLDGLTGPSEAGSVVVADRHETEAESVDHSSTRDEPDSARAEAPSLLAMMPGAPPAARADGTLPGGDGADMPSASASLIPEAAGESADEPVAAPQMRIILRETHFAPVMPTDPRRLEAPAPAFSLEPTDPQGTMSPSEDRSRQPGIADPRPTLRDSKAEPQPRMEGQVQPMQEEEGQTPATRNGRADEVASVAPASGGASLPSSGNIGAPAPLAAAPPSSLASGSPAEQVSTAIRHAGTSPLANGMPMGPSGGPVRILEIQLNPMELGVVTVRLRNGRDGLEIRVQAARAETAQLLAQDRSALLASLSDQGHVPADLTITSFGATAGLTGHDARTPAHAPWRAPDEDAGRRQPDSGTRRDDRQNPQNQNPRHRDTGERAAD